MDRIVLENLVKTGATQREIGCAIKVSQATVKYWLKKYGLKTQVAEMWATNSNVFLNHGEKRSIVAVCKRHGEGRFLRKKRGRYRCKKCDWLESYTRRTKNRKILVQEHGGKCERCGFDNAIALEFHHRNKNEKEFAIGVRAFRSLDNLRKEASKCDLLCANCHRIVEHELRLSTDVTQSVE